jgi:CO dehydrogenase/acetyl-CoA synthase delta subunit
LSWNKCNRSCVSFSKIILKYSSTSCSNQCLNSSTSLNCKCWTITSCSNDYHHLQYQIQQMKVKVYNFTRSKIQNINRRRILIKPTTPQFVLLQLSTCTWTS